MDFSWLLQASTWIGFFTLLALEVVLGIDNLVFVAILANKVKPEHRDRTRMLGLGLAIVVRLFMLAGVSYQSAPRAKGRCIEEFLTCYAQMI